MKSFLKYIIGFYFKLRQVSLTNADRLNTRIVITCYGGPEVLQIKEGHTLQHSNLEATKAALFFLRPDNIDEPVGTKKDQAHHLRANPTQTGRASP